MNSTKALIKAELQEVPKCGAISASAAWGSHIAASADTSHFNEFWLDR